MGSFFSTVALDKASSVHDVYPLSTLVLGVQAVQQPLAQLKEMNNSEKLQLQMAGTLSKVRPYLPRALEIRS